MAAHRILLLNGPNLNLLGAREPDHYGVRTLEHVVKRLTGIAGGEGAALTSFQSNAEHELID
jgi:3-dehydroquinate dehydratase-2